jgi:hypothetical protein
VNFSLESNDKYRVVLFVDLQQDDNFRLGTVRQSQQSDRRDFAPPIEDAA